MIVYFVNHRPIQLEELEQRERCWPEPITRCDGGLGGLQTVS
jgi:hypothetical protein